MTTTLRTLAVTSCYLLFAACSGETQHERPAQPAPRSAPKETKPPRAEEGLTATAPTRPRTVLDETDLLVKGAVEPAAVAPDGGEAPLRSGEPTSLAWGHDAEPGVPDSYDRPLRAGEVQISRFVLATGVEQREPTDVSDAFDQDTPQIFAFVELANEHEPYAFEVHFEKVGGPKSLYGVKLHVGQAARYRTWAWTKIRREPGAYRAVLRTLTGEEIASRDFVITEPAHD